MAGKPEQEPSIEEILASIRQIISDDDQPQSDVDLSAGPEEKFTIPVAQPEAEDDIINNDDDDVLDLTNEISREADIDLSAGPEERFTIPVAEPKPEPVRPEPVLEQAPAPPKPAVRQQPPAQPMEIDLNDHEDDQSIDTGQSIFTETAASATASAFSKLVGNIPVEREDNRTMFADGRITLEDIAKDLMRPILRDWIDQNLPRIVERLVEKELEKLARQARDD